MKKILVVALLSTLAASPAFAADEGFYFGVTAGQGKTDNVATNTTMTSSSSSVAGILAGYQFSRKLGVEAFFTGVGKWTATTGAVTLNGKGDALGVSAVGTLPMSGSLSLYGKVGIANVSSSITSSPASNASGTSRTAATIGLGMQYNAAPNVGIRLGWDQYGEALNVSAGTNKFNASVWSLGAVFKF